MSIRVYTSYRNVERGIHSSSKFVLQKYVFLLLLYSNYGISLLCKPILLSSENGTSHKTSFAINTGDVKTHPCTISFKGLFMDGICGKTLFIKHQNRIFLRICYYIIFAKLIYAIYLVF